jgi:hypothetical protein
MGTGLLGFVFYVLMHPAFPGARSKRSPHFCLDLLVMHGSWCGVIRQEADPGGPHCYFRVSINAAIKSGI